MLPVFPNKQAGRAQIAATVDLPPLTGALQRILEIINNELTSSKELENIILYDQSLTAKILRLANGSFYGMRGQVSSVSQAIMLLGYEQVKYVCLCTLFMQICGDEFNLSPDTRERLWKHALATARLARGIAERKPWVNTQQAYVLGLLHDLGRVAMAVHFKDYYETVTRLSEARRVPHWQIESELGLTHMEIGKWMCIKWGLPEVFKHTMEYHHYPARSPSHSCETHLVYLANVVANSEHFPEYLRDPLTLNSCAQLCITEEDWDRFIEQSPAIWPQVDMFW